MKSLIILISMLVGVLTNQVYPPSKVIKLSLGISKAAYLPFSPARYIKNGAIIENESTMTPRLFILPPKYNPYQDKEACSIKEWTAKDFVYKETEVVMFTSVKQKLAIFAFRGTEPTNLQDWAANFNLLPGPLVLGNVTMMTHRGFVVRYRNIAPWFEREYTNVPQNYNIVLTGHSLGAAEATIAAMFTAAKLKRRPDAVVTFGSPYPGLGSLRYYYNKMVGCDRTVRIAAKCDPFTIVPISVPGYKHVCDGIEIDGNTGLNFIKTHSLYVGYDRGLKKKYTNVNEINYGCDQLLN